MINPDLSKLSGTDCITVVVLKNDKPVDDNACRYIVDELDEYVSEEILFPRLLGDLACGPGI